MLSAIVQTGPEPIATQGNLDVRLDPRAFQEWSVPGEIRGHGEGQACSPHQRGTLCRSAGALPFRADNGTGRPKVPGRAGIRPEEWRKPKLNRPSRLFRVAELLGLPRSQTVRHISESDCSCDCVPSDKVSGCVANVWTVLVLRDVRIERTGMFIEVYRALY